jgi:hypothetical protein
MAFILVPKTTQKVIGVFSEALDLKKIEKADGKFWHGNFNDFLYAGLDGMVKVLFAGYSGAVAGQALLEYASNYRAEDRKPEVYFFGSVYAFKDSDLEPGDLVYARDTYSPDSFEQSIYQNARAKNLERFTEPDPKLLDRILSIAKSKGYDFRSTKVYCCITPGFMPDFTKPSQLMNEAMWWPVSLSGIGAQGCDSGEYESASVLATCRLLGIPAVALLDVKDKRYSTTDYRIATEEQKIQALSRILDVIRGSIGD